MSQAHKSSPCAVLESPLDMGFIVTRGDLKSKRTLIMAGALPGVEVMALGEGMGLSYVSC